MYRLITLFILALLMAACGTIAVPVEVIHPVDEALIERGIAVYRTNYCGSCHTLTIANTRGTFGPNHDHVLTSAATNITLETYTGEAQTPIEYIRESLLNPAVFYTPGFEATNHHMPAFTHLPPEDIEAMVYMLSHQPD